MSKEYKYEVASLGDARSVVVKGYHFKRSGLLFVELACRSGAYPITVGGAPTVVLLA